ncbi:MAG: hypothetical protein M1817_002969 [Caeruleum heppii]|nr:MAG: hypothetical protein M1817_002969 [Caeruleum heppii]
MVIGRKIYVYGGRDAEGSPLDEHGKIWVFATDTGQWSSIDPTSKSPRLPDRFDHAMVADEHPLPTLRSDKERPEPIDPDVHYGTIFVHAGIGKARKRLNDLWSFDLASRTWAQFADAPEPVRSGASLALAQNRIYRFGGYDGQNDVGGKLDYLDLKVAIFDDQTMTGEVALTALSGVWDSLPLEGPTDSVELLPRPVARSYAGLVPVSLGQGRSYLLLIGGDGSAGKAAGDHSSNICSDIWSYQLRPQGMTAASIKDATRMVAGKETGEGKWEPVEVQGESDFDGEEIRDGIGPGPRIRYDCAAVDFDTTKIVLWGGIGAGGQRWGDGWILNVI